MAAETANTTIMSILLYSMVFMSIDCGRRAGEGPDHDNQYELKLYCVSHRTPQRTQRVWPVIPSPKTASLPVSSLLLLLLCDIWQWGSFHHCFRGPLTSHSPALLALLQWTFHRQPIHSLETPQKILTINVTISFYKPSLAHCSPSFPRCEVDRRRLERRRLFIIDYTIYIFEQIHPPGTPLYATSRVEPIPAWVTKRCTLAWSNKSDLQ